MPLVLTCACGARFELEDALAGEQVPCPDCQVLVKAPDVPSPQPRTSYWALAGTVLALTGAFTVVGTIAAIGCGIVALVRIRRHPDRLRGNGFALFGVIAGLLLTLTTLFALSRGLFASWGDQLRETLLADQIDFSGPLPINDPTRPFTLARPTKYWGKRIDNDKPTDPVLLALNRTKADLTLVEPKHSAFVDVRLVTDQKKQLPQAMLAAIVQGYAESNPDVEFSYFDVKAVDAQSTDYETEFTAQANHRRWRIFARLYCRNDKEYLVRGYIPENQSERAWAEIKTAISSFKSKE